MTQEDKNTLLKDLCARLPYGVRVKQLKPIKELELYLTSIYKDTVQVETVTGGIMACSIEAIKPYLRPMSSMTEEEYLKYSETRDWRYVEDDHYEYFDTLETFDWLNEHQFDFRNLISRGLAIDCTNLNIY